jgi:hypothetical protein
VLGSGYPPAGVYKYQNGTLTVVADGSTAIPGHPVDPNNPQQARFVDLGHVVSLSGNDVAFQGGNPYTGWYGVYRTSNGAVQKVADPGTTIPGTSDNFFVWSFVSPSIGGIGGSSTVAFTGTDSPFVQNPRGQGGVYCTTSSGWDVHKRYQLLVVEWASGRGR